MECGDVLPNSKLLLRGDKSAIDRRQIGQGNYLVRLLVRLSPRLEALSYASIKKGRRGTPSAHTTTS
jgi:hypothetical protein